MSYENLINGFMDGTLDSVQEESLFSAIAANEELRSHFKQQLAIEKTCKQYAASLVPPAHTTVGVFSALGIKIKPIPHPTITKSALTAKGTFFGKMLYGVIGALVATLLTTSVFIAYIIPESKNPNYSTYSFNHTNSISYNDLLNSNNVQTNLPLVSSYEINKTNSNKYINKIVPAVHQNEKVDSDERITSKDFDEFIPTNKEKSSENIPTELNESNMININYFNKSIDNKFTNNFNNLFKPDYSYLQNITKTPSNLGLLAEIKGNQYYSLLNTSVPQAQNVNFSNMGLNLLYNINNDFALGLSIRQENFPQHYEGSDEAGNEFIYKQNPNLISVGLIGRYSFIHFGQFGLFSEAEFGANKAGVLGRLAAGIEYTPENVIYMNFGIEASGLRYQHNDRVFFTPKAGLFYSIGVKF